MTAVLDVAVGRMLAAFGTRVSEERVIAFTEAVEEAGQCEPCAVRACKNLSGSMKRCPYPVNLVEETMDVQGSAAHLAHVNDRKQLSAGDLETWWSTEGPVIVRSCWRELSGEQAIVVSKKLFQMGHVHPDRESIGAELGFLDERGPTVERAWWMKEMSVLVRVPAGNDALPVGDR
jgi:hypothetical protein